MIDKYIFKYLVLLSMGIYKLTNPLKLGWYII